MSILNKIGKKIEIDNACQKQQQRIQTKGKEEWLPHAINSAWEASIGEGNFYFSYKPYEDSWQSKKVYGVRRKGSSRLARKKYLQDIHGGG